MMALVNLNSNNNVLQREKDKENERSEFLNNNKSKNFNSISGSKKDGKNDQNVGKQLQYVENQNHKNKKEKNFIRRKQKANNINIQRSPAATSKPQNVKNVETKMYENKDYRTSKHNNNNGNANSYHYQYDRNHLYSLGMQMQVGNQRSSPNRLLTPPSYRNMNLSPSTTESSSRINGNNNYDLSNFAQYPMLSSNDSQWFSDNQQKNHHRYSSQHYFDNNNWNQQYNWNSYSNHNQNYSYFNSSYEGHQHKTWRSSNSYSSNRSYRSPSSSPRPDAASSPLVRVEINQDVKRTSSPSPSSIHSQSSCLRRSLSKSSLNDRSSRASVNSSPDNISSELEYDSDSSKSCISSAKIKHKEWKNYNKKKSYKKYPIVYESRSAPDMSHFNEYRASSEYAQNSNRSTNYSENSSSCSNLNNINHNNTRSNTFYQQQQGFYGNQQLSINNWVSTLAGNMNNNLISNSLPQVVQMFSQDFPYESVNNGKNNSLDCNMNQKQYQKKEKSSGKELVSADSSIINSTTILNSSVPPAEPNNNYMMCPNPYIPFQQNVLQSRTKHVMNHVHKFNSATNNNNNNNKVQVPSPASVTPSIITPLSNVTPESFSYKSSLPFVKDAPKDLLNNSKWDSLSKDIWEKFMANQQSEAMYTKKINLWKFLYLNIKSQFPQYGLYMVGSTIAGFGTDSSDVDMCLVSKESPSCVDLRANAVFILSNIQSFLRNFPVFEEFHLIQARVPILRFHDIEHKIEVDLNYNNSVGIRNTHLLHCYAELDWRLRPLVLIVKLWAQFNNINDARNSTLSSYSLVLMVIHFLQCGTVPAVLPCLQKLFPDTFSANRDFTQINMNETFELEKSQNTETLGELFINFLAYYSKFDYSRYAISVRTASCLLIDHCRSARSPKNDMHQWKVLCIEEPFDLTNTARSVYDPEVFERIKVTFHSSWKLLSQNNRLDSVLSTPLFTPFYQQLHQSTEMPNIPIIITSPQTSNNRTNISQSQKKEAIELKDNH
uniref:CSON013906 protein n=1 Tax=Culicoides sonorensis TaxID=179676 RepID=A0A336KST5_CULSO